MNGLFLAIDRNTALSHVFLVVLSRVLSAKPGVKKSCNFQMFLAPQYHSIYSNTVNIKSLKAGF